MQDKNWWQFLKQHSLCGIHLQLQSPQLHSHHSSVVSCGIHLQLQSPQLHSHHSSVVSHGVHLQLQSPQLHSHHSSVVSPEISSNHIFQKFMEWFYRKFPTTTNLPNNCQFAYHDTFQRLLPLDYSSAYFIIIRTQYSYACFHKVRVFPAY